MTAPEDRAFLLRLTAIVESVARSEGLPAGVVRRAQSSVFVESPGRTPVEFRGRTGASDDELDALVHHYVGEVAPRNDAVSISVNTYTLDHETAHDLIERERDQARTEADRGPAPVPSGDGWFAYAPNTGVLFHAPSRRQRLVAWLRRRRR